MVGALAVFLLLACAKKKASPAPPDPVENAGVIAVQQGGEVVLSNERVSISVDLERGGYTVASADGTLWVERAESRVHYKVGDATPQITGTTDPGQHSWTAWNLADRLGAGVVLTVTFRPEAAGAPRLETRFELRQGASWLTMVSSAHWEPAPAGGVRISQISPLVADLEGGGALYLGADPAEHRVLDSGYDLYFDFEARVTMVGASPSLLYPPGTVSNWNAGLYDPASDRGLVAGFLTAEQGAGMVAVDFKPNLAPEDEGRLGFTRFEGFSLFLEGRQADGDATGVHINSELFYLDPAPQSVHAGLEGFADRIAQQAGRTLWTKVPAGWNSWGGGAGSGGYGTTIDATLMLENLELAAVDFLPYGMEHFMLDDGWQVADGDWTPRPDRFPNRDGKNGMKWFADEIRARGMIPGLWVSPYTVDADSQLAADHPDWMADISPLGMAVVPQNQHVLDLSHPEVQDWLAALFTQVTQDWGYRWIKMDFSYYALFTTNLHDPDVTPTEAYRQALKRIREAVGPDVFFLTIAATGLCLELADGGRITLDNEPWWRDPDNIGRPEILGEQGIRATYRTVAKRYYLNHHAWLNHPDLLFYRDDYGLTLEEARVWTTVVGLTGGIVKLGENYLELHDHPEWREQVTKLLPVYPDTGRPLDLFTRELPERWLLQVTRGDHSWQVLGLFNWGKNRDIGVSAWEPEADRSFQVELAALGVDTGRPLLVFDSWAQTWEWIDPATGPLDETLGPRSTRVLILRSEPEQPAIVATDRHLLGGAVEISGEHWDEASRTLTANIATVPADPITVYVAPVGATFDQLTAPGTLDATASERDGLVVIELLPSTELTPITLTFVN